MKIVELDRVNAGLLGSIATEVFDHPIDPQQLEAFLADPRHLMVLAVDAGAVVGMASAVEYFHPDKPPQLWINEVGVTPTHRRQGSMSGVAARDPGTRNPALSDPVSARDAPRALGSAPGARRRLPGVPDPERSPSPRRTA